MVMVMVVVGWWLFAGCRGCGWLQVMHRMIAVAVGLRKTPRQELLHLLWVVSQNPQRDVTLRV